MSKIKTTKEQINSILAIEKQHLVRFDYIMHNNDDYNTLLRIAKNEQNPETKKLIQKEASYYKNTILPVRKKEREHIVKGISLLKQMIRDYDDLKSLAKLTRKFANHLDVMDAYKTYIYENGFQIWS